MFPASLRPPRLSTFIVATTLAVGSATATAAVASATTPELGAAASTSTRSFSCSGRLDLPSSALTITGQLTDKNVPKGVTITDWRGAALSSQTGRALLVGPSVVHSGYLEWDVTVPDPANPTMDGYRLNLPPVLPGGGGFFDADLEVQYAQAGANVWQLFDCTVTGGSRRLAHPERVRTFSCTGQAAELATRITITGRLDRRNTPSNVTVTDWQGAVVSTRRAAATTLGASVLHSGYTSWDITGVNPDGNLYHLDMPPVLPAAGGYFDADSDVLFSGGAFGGMQTPMFDCTVK